MLHGFDRQLRVLIVRCGNQHSVDLRILQKSLAILVDLYILRKALLCPLSSLLFPVSNGNKLHSLNVPVCNPLRMAGTHISDSDDSDFYNFFTHTIKFLPESSPDSRVQV